MDSVNKLKAIIENGKYSRTPTQLMVTAGFEDRNIASVRIIAASNLQVDSVIILDYQDKNLNEPMRSTLISETMAAFPLVDILNINDLSEIKARVIGKGTKLLVDITGMSRIDIFEILYFMDSNEINYDLVYTEAEIYFPLKVSLDILQADSVSDEIAFSRYLDSEKVEFVYSYDCKILHPDAFGGQPEPGKPAMLLSFLTFKRSRLQLILKQLQLEKKFLILGTPVRDDLLWRKKYMEIANWDLMQKNRQNIKEISTLDPLTIKNILHDCSYVNRDYTKYNIFLAPLGSKMQTVGAYLYWRDHPDVTVLFSQPNKYFTETYSKYYRDTFVLPYESFKYSGKRPLKSV